ncbi:MAG: hypothetical protein ACLQU1_20820 [Bryobacteraceae bacterium]
MAGNKQGHGEHEVRPPDLQRPEGDQQPGYEVRDVNAWAVGKFAIGLVLLCIFAIVVLLGFFNYLETSHGPIAGTARDLRPQPRLESTPVPDLKAMRDAEDKILNSYGWVDQPKGVVRIPIAQAIDLLAQRGLPARPQNGVQSASDASVPTESGLGPKVQQVGGPLAGVGK